MTAAGRASGPGGAVPWPHDLARRLAEIRDITAPGMESAAPPADTLAVECLPAIRFLARGRCRELNRPDLVQDAGQDASFDVLRELRSGAGRRDILPYLGQVVRNAVSRCITAGGGLYPTAGQRRRASIARAFGLFLSKHGRSPSDTELLTAQHRLVSSRSDARGQAALAFPEEVRAYIAGEEPFFTDSISGPGPRPTDCRLPRLGDHVDADLALDPLDTQRLISLTAVACRNLHPKVNGQSFAAAVMANAMRGTLDVTRLARDCGLTRSVARTAVAKVWKAAKRVARDDLGITSVRVGPEG